MGAYSTPCHKAKPLTSNQRLSIDVLESAGKAEVHYQSVAENEEQSCLADTSLDNTNPSAEKALHTTTAEYIFEDNWNHKAAWRALCVKGRASTKDFTNNLLEQPGASRASVATARWPAGLKAEIEELPVALLMGGSDATVKVATQTKPQQGKPQPQPLKHTNQTQQQFNDAIIDS